MRLETIYYSFFTLICIIVLTFLVVALFIILFLRRANEKKKLEIMVQSQTEELTKRLQETTAELESLKSAGKSKSAFYINISN